MTTVYNRTRCLFLFALYPFLFCQEAFGVRPFVTDDARIVDQGQITSEIWGELDSSGGPYSKSLHGLVGISPTQWWEITAVSTLGLEQKIFSDVSNPVLQSKFLLFPSEEDGPPGVAVSVGYVPSLGNGPSFVEGSGSYVLMLLSKRLLKDQLLVHGNVGWTSSWTEVNGDKTRPFWGVGAEFALWVFEWRGVAEIFSGDPFDLLRSDLAAQAGFRWLHSDLFNFDLIAGTQPQVSERLVRTGRTEHWIQLGVRITFDAFVSGGRKGRATGGEGLFPGLN